MVALVAVLVVRVGVLVVVFVVVVDFHDLEVMGFEPLRLDPHILGLSIL